MARATTFSVPPASTFSPTAAFSNVMPTLAGSNSMPPPPEPTAMLTLSGSSSWLPSGPGDPVGKGERFCSRRIPEMKRESNYTTWALLSNLCWPLLSNICEIALFLSRRLLWAVLSYGPIPDHIAIIMDGNRRFAQKQKLNRKSGHEYGSRTLLSTLRYCYEMGITHVTVYAFSIDNFNRDNAEVADLMELIVKKTDELLRRESIVNWFGVRIRFLGNLRLFPEDVRASAERAMAATAGNSKYVLSICVAYTSRDEIVNAVEGSWREKGRGEIGVEDLERNLYTTELPEPDILIRTSGETRLSNFLLWQTSFCYLHLSGVLWPDFSLRHLVWAVLRYQRVWPYLEKKKRERQLDKTIMGF